MTIASQAEPRPPHVPVVGVLGAGQLGRMLAVAGLRLGVELRFLTPTDSGATQGIGTTVVYEPGAAGPRGDVTRLREFVAGCTVLTVENEWAPLEAAARLAAELGQGLGRTIACHPSPASLATIADKLTQKQRLAGHGVALGPFRGCATLAEAEAAAETLGWPVVVKRRRGAYDGYGNRSASTPAELAEAWAQLAEADGALLEAHVPFVRELAVSVARRPNGECVVYPVVHTKQADHRCAAVIAPAPVEVPVREAAVAIAQAATEALDLVGVCAVELFELADGRLWLNEVAPRPHNSAHYTIEACVTSQFENHLRAVLDLPLGDPSLRVPAAVMVNLLGPAKLADGHPRASPDIRGALAIPGASVHLYGKREARANRKLGHITTTGEDPQQLEELAQRAAAAVRF